MIIQTVIALIVLQIIIMFLQRKKSKSYDTESSAEERHRRIDAILKGRIQDEDKSAPEGISLIGIEDFSAIPDEKRQLRRDILLIKDAVTAGLRAKIGRRATGGAFEDPERMFDGIVELIQEHMKKG